MALRALFVDVGNTLLREEPSRFELYAVQARARGVAIAEGEMSALMHRAHHELPSEIDGEWRYTEPDWDELRAVVTGHGPASADRVAFRQASWDEQAWVRAAVAGVRPAAA